ncbi:extracellular solute-binding protein [Paenibacillus sp. J5C_2022]|uniref:extracellular solute-binding protein n=1 Tax=Paenibacillus sp. J5C2022 TaxID=2977129 RepID=UPI0021D2E579|nr:extracellular solute-binding protein [Paenibacillus sp. J5C2022]MCU6712116.1 extracellular solute-binding protein [Paenibacillus sp. J5C2022]
MNRYIVIGNRLTSCIGLLLFLTVIFIGCDREEQQELSETEQKGTYLEVWGTSSSEVPIRKDGKYSAYLMERTGVGIYSPVVLWDGGRGYAQRLNTRIASGQIPDLFQPWLGNEAALMKQGMLADLTDELPVYAPHIWEQIPDAIWEAVRSSDPTGRRRIYYIPSVHDYTYYGPVIRKDWLDRVGMEVPKSKEQYVEVLRAFRDQDANGNGDPHDEVPLSGREHGRWIDHLFGMYGVAMWEGFPAWHLYDGQLTYSAVTSNMKDALAFIRELYAEGLLDPDTFLNSASDWLELIHSDRMGSWFHINDNADIRMNRILNVNKEMELVPLGIPEVAGREGFIAITRINRPQWVVAAKDEQTTRAALKLLDWASNPANLADVIMGAEGVHYQQTAEGGVTFKTEPAKTETKFILPVYFSLSDALLSNELIRQSLRDEDQRKVSEWRDAIMIGNQPFGQIIAGDGIPSSIYEDYPEIRGMTLYREYMTKIVIGDWPLDKFDEFVQKWEQMGGREVTERARLWYSGLRSE